MAGFASPHKNRDLIQANLTLPLLHSYQALSTQGRSQFLQLWTELRRAKAAQKEKVVTTVDSLPQIPELIELLRAEKVASIGVLETLANAYNFVAQAQACLAFDPYCVEHQTMLEFLQNLLKLIASTFKNLFEV